MLVLNNHVKAEVRKQPFKCIPRENLKSRENPWKATVKEFFFWQSCRPLACKFTKSELLLRYFTRILLKLEVSFFHNIFRNLITTIFKEHLLVDTSESYESWTVFWDIGAFGILKHHKNSKHTYFSENLLPFTACFSLTF